MFLVRIDSWGDKESVDVKFFEFRDVGPGVGFDQFRDFLYFSIVFAWASFLSIF